jgi:hypothetical protein
MYFFIFIKINKNKIYTNLQILQFNYINILIILILSYLYYFVS